MLNTQPQIIQNAVYVPSQRTYYVSAHVHDFIPFSVGDEEHFIDGGTDYFRSTLLDSAKADKLVVDYCLTSANTLDEIRQKLLWGTYGKDGRQPLAWLPISELSVEHLGALIAALGARADSIRLDAIHYWYRQKTSASARDRAYANKHFKK